MSFVGHVEARSAETVAIVLEGEIDASVEHELDELLARAVALAHPRVIVDLGEVTYFGCRGAGALIRAWAAATEAGKTLHVVGANDYIRKLATTLGIAKMLEPRLQPQRRTGDALRPRR
jgi:anti-sigma B factor antagonist